MSRCTSAVYTGGTCHGSRHYAATVYAVTITLGIVMGPRGTGLPVAMRELLDRGGVILTANARAARALHLRYAEHKQAEHAIAWPTPQILDLYSWLTEQWQSLLLTGTEDRLLLNDLQERALWERLITPAVVKLSLIEPARLAALAQDAYSLLAAYRSLERLNHALWMAEPSSEPEVFRQWARSFQQECTRHRWMPRCELTDAVADALRFGVLSPPTEIGWLGFDRATPADEALKAALEARSTRQQTLSWEVEQCVPPTLYAAQASRTRRQRARHGCASAWKPIRKHA